MEELLQRRLEHVAVHGGHLVPYRTRRQDTSVMEIRVDRKGLRPREVPLWLR